MTDTEEVFEKDPIMDSQKLIYLEDISLLKPRHL